MAMPRRLFDLPEFVVADPAAFADCLDHLKAADRLGFDTEFVGEDSYRPELCLVQVATAERLYVIDPYGCGPLDGFWELLLDPDRVAVVHAGREEVRMCRFGIGRPPANIFDVQIAAALIGLSFPLGYAGLVQEVVGARAHKGETLTDWRRRPLTPAQIKYAFDDVRFLLPIHDKISHRLTELGRTGWAAEEFGGFVRWATAEDPAIEKWRRLKGTGGMSRRELAVVRAVFAWRESFAARLNRPPRVLLRDDLLVELARRPPATPEAVAGLRGVPRGEVEAIAGAVQEAMALSPDEYPEAIDRENDPPHVAQVAGLLGTVLAEFCGRNFLAPNLVAASADLKGLVRSRQPGGRLPDDSPFASGWRAEAVLPVMDATLDGRLAVRVQDPASPTPFVVGPA
jgi:ribonuclease D